MKTSKLHFLCQSYYRCIVFHQLLLAPFFIISLLLSQKLEVVSPIDMTTRTGMLMQQPPPSHKHTHVHRIMILTFVLPTLNYSEIVETGNKESLTEVWCLITSTLLLAKKKKRKK